VTGKDVLQANEGDSGKLTIKEQIMATQTQSRQDKSGQDLQRSQQDGQQNEMQPFDDLYKYFQDYARERPDMVALCCFGLGFILGWRLKPW